MMLVLDMPPPPANVTEWIVFILALGSFVVALRRWAIQPLLRVLGAVFLEMRVHNVDHEILRRELAPNGGEQMLPPHERDDSIRNLVIRNRVDHLQHTAWSDAVVAILNAERAEQGLPPLREPPALP